MQTERERFTDGFVKVCVRSRSPTSWGWELHRNGSKSPLERSVGMFQYAEDAWNAGQIALTRSTFFCQHRSETLRQSSYG
jgi:hypothetical protein